MPFELYCSHCAQSFSVSPGSPVAAVLERVAQQGPWSALGDGETFEDSLSTELSDQQLLSCPDCGRSVFASEASLGQFAQQLLGQW
jgi:hypothetical protein